MRHRMPNLLALLSLVLCTATIVLWVTSLRSGKYFGLCHPIGISAMSGQVECSYFPSLGSMGRWSIWTGSSVGVARIAAVNSRHRQRAWWFGLDWDPNADSRSGLGKPHIILSDWFICLVTMIPAVLWLLQNRRDGRITARRCHQCGYDLRASSDRCPECGTAIPDRDPKATSAHRPAT
jgi:hypothetical protein